MLLIWPLDRKIRRTADPSAALGMTKGKGCGWERAVAEREVVVRAGEDAVFFSNHPLSATTLSSCHPELTRIYYFTALTGPLMWFSLKRTTCSRPKPQLLTGNLGKPRDLQFYGPLLGMF
jgi:hypothetical protein